MPECPICGLGERCRNHWVAQQTPQGEVEFQIGAMTASEDNLILLRNKLQNPPLRAVFERIGLQPRWVEEQGRVLAYLDWPLELRAAVNRALFPNGAPGASPAPPEPLPLFAHQLDDLRLVGVSLDFEHCLPDELLYAARFELRLAGLGAVYFEYMQLVWADGVEWARRLSTPQLRGQAEGVVRLLLGGLEDPLRGLFAGQPVEVVAEAATAGLDPGVMVDEVAVGGPPELHLGEEIERLANERRLQPMLRDSLIGISLAAPTLVH